MKHTATALAVVLALALSSTAMAKDAHEKRLPPGLQKKEQRGQALPPGWQKKLSRGDVLDEDIYRESTVIKDDKGLVTIRVEGKLIKVIENTREIVEILDTL
ncbi:hypothetical protein [Motiliproteus sp. SC1-56]|uniref:hypothetical protein n=1 Tax=Motiliproteus sp. SC1-56 TaxID=2799565 RepID=UPI001A8FF3A8|nr:hypothetical protein [Motiliproteus sp. SC1-56]